MADSWIDTVAKLAPTVASCLGSPVVGDGGGNSILTGDANIGSSGGNGYVQISWTN